MYCLLLAIFLSCSLNTTYLYAMEDSNRNRQEQPSTARKTRKIVLLVNRALPHSNQALYNQKEHLAVEAAESCDLIELQKYVTPANVNIIKSQSGLSLLSLSLRRQTEEEHFDTSAPDYLIAQGASIHEKTEGKEQCSPLVYSVGAAILGNNFSPLEYLLSKNGNPFTLDQNALGSSAAGLTVQLKNSPLPTDAVARKKRVLAMFCERVKNLPQALETYDLLTIQRFLNPETVNRIDEEGLTPLLRVVFNYTASTRQITYQILDLLLRTGANPNQVGAIQGIKKTPLFFTTEIALLTGDTLAIPPLLKHGANPKLEADPDTMQPPFNSAYAMARYYSTQPSMRSVDRLPPEDVLLRRTAANLVALFDVHEARKISTKSLNLE